MFDFNLPVAHIPDNYREFLPTMTTPAVDELLYGYEVGESEMRRLHADLMCKENRGALESFAYGAEAYHQSKAKSSYWGWSFLSCSTCRVGSMRDKSTTGSGFSTCAV